MVARRVAKAATATRRTEKDVLVVVGGSARWVVCVVWGGFGRAGVLRRHDALGAPRPPRRSESIGFGCRLGLGLGLGLASGCRERSGCGVGVERDVG